MGGEGSGRRAGARVAARATVVGGGVVVGLVALALLAGARGGPLPSTGAMVAAPRAHATATVLPHPTAVPTATPRPPDTLRLFVGPGSGVWSFVRGLDEARQRVLLTAGALDDPRITRALLGARARGVDVRVLYDATGVTTATLRNLAAAGVLLRAANPAFTALQQATLVVDGRYVLLSTGMLTPAGFDATRSFVVRDLDRLAVAQVAAVFYDDWERRPPALFVSHLVVGPPQAGSAAGHLIDLATTHLDVFTQRLDDPALTAALLAAHERGVRVRVLTAEDSGWGADVELVIAGLKVRRLASPAVRGTVILQDGQRAYLSSLALAATAAGARGMGILLRAEGIVRVLGQTFDADWAQGTVVTKPPPPRPRVPACRATRRHPCAAATPTPLPAAPAPALATVGPGAHRRTITTPPLAGVALRPSLTLLDPVSAGSQQELVVTSLPGAHVTIVATYADGTTRTAGGDGVAGPAGTFVDRWTIPRTAARGPVTLAILVRHGTGWRSFNAVFTVR